MGKVISIVNQKGGVGKTTTAINLSAALALNDKKALLIDFDPQSNTTSGLGIDYKKIQKSIYHVLLGEVPGKEIILKTDIDNLFLIPSNIDLTAAEIELLRENEKEYKFKKAIEELKKEYDYILVDCPPSLGMLTINALTASQSVMIPIQCEYYALEGLAQLLKTVELVKKNFNYHLSIEGIILTMFDTRLKISHQVVEEVKKYFSNYVYDTIIHRNIRLAEAPSFGKPIILYDLTSKGSKNYLNLAKEVISNE